MSSPLEARHIRMNTIRTLAIALSAYRHISEDEVLEVARQAAQVTRLPLVTLLDAWCNAERVLSERQGETSKGRKK